MSGPTIRLIFPVHPGRNGRGGSARRASFEWTVIDRGSTFAVRGLAWLETEAYEAWCFAF